MEQQLPNKTNWKNKAQPFNGPVFNTCKFLYSLFVIRYTIRGSSFDICLESIRKALSKWSDLWDMEYDNL